MEKEVKRWSLPINKNQSLGEFLQGTEYEDSSYRFDTIDSLLNHVYHMLLHIEGSAETIKKSNYDIALCEEEVNELELESDAYLRVGEINNLFIVDGVLRQVYEVLKILTVRGYDIRPQWRDLRDWTKRLWVCMPDISKAYKVKHAKRGITDRNSDIPDSYNPDKPYPDLEIPQDIEE